MTAHGTIQQDSGTQWLALLPSAARASSAAQVVQVNSQNCDVDALIVILDVTAVTATGTLTVLIEGVDPQTDNTYPILQGVAVSTAVRTVYRVHPNLPSVTNLTAQDVVPPIFRVTVTPGNTVSMTYSVTALLPD